MIGAAFIHPLPEALNIPHSPVLHPSFLAASWAISFQFFIGGHADLMMLEFDGWRFRHAQRGDAQMVHIPTLIVTGSALHHIVHDQLQAADYLLKPVIPHTS
jgi:hypothetical protein